MLPLALLFAAVPAAEYAGSAACKTCHPAEYASQSATAHAKSLEHSKPGQPGEWAFGAGAQAVTFVSRVDSDHYLEHGESWYTKLGRYAPTPGHRTTGGVRHRVFDASAAILRCFACHSTGPVSVAPDGRIVPAEMGVRCEDCHGPSAGHARDPERVRPLQPGRMSANQVNDVCGACHRMPAASASTVDLRDPWNARHQPLLLAASACFERSGGRLSCFSCHRPHANVERRQAAYDGACAQCHPAPKHSRPVMGKACTGCHMPAVAPQPGLTFANHRIAVYRAGDPLTPVTRR